MARAQVSPLTRPPPREGVSNEKEKGRLDRDALDWIQRHRRQTFSWTPPDIPAGAVTDATFTASGDGEVFTDLRPGMRINVSPPSALPPGLTLSASVVKLDELVVRLDNRSGASITPPAGTWSFEGQVGPGGR